MTTTTSEPARFGTDDAIDQPVSDVRLERVIQDTRALRKVLTQLANAESVEEAIAIALGTVREEFGWDYASYWTLDLQRDALVFAVIYTFFPKEWA